ncbi:MAG: hypothetical protein OYH77_01230 [Pseudomonadota bacterium]|nr:hypothetical protein [Pseudomonadota bacterium]
MEGVNILTGLLFPLINFLLFLTALVAIARKPLINFAKAKREDFLRKIHAASSTADELTQLEAAVQKEETSIATEVTDITTKTKQSTTDHSSAFAKETTAMVAQLQLETDQIITAYRQEMHAQLQQQILAAIEQRLVNELPKHDEVGRSNANTKLAQATLS